MLGPALRDKHAPWGPTSTDGPSRFSTTALEAEIQTVASSRRWFSHELWSHPLAEVERILVPQSRAKHRTRNSRAPVTGRSIPSVNNCGHTLTGWTWGTTAGQSSGANDSRRSHRGTRNPRSSRIRAAQTSRSGSRDERDGLRGLTLNVNPSCLVALQPRRSRPCLGQPAPP
jgi:hypothetical protein